MTSGGKKDSTYVDDVFSSYLWKGNNQNGRPISNGIKLNNDSVGNSVYFNGSGQIEIASTSDFAFGTGDYTVEFWMNYSSASDYMSIFEGRPTNGNGEYFSIQINGGNLQVYINSVTLIQVTAPATSQWHHIAVVREGTGSNQLKLYINGTQSGQATDTANYGNQRCLIAGHAWSRGSFYGNLSNYRVTKGQALYTSNFTPSTQALTTTSQGATASNVKLLCCQSSISATAATKSPSGISETGSVESQLFGPFTGNDGEGGMVWVKNRTQGGSGYESFIADTVRGNARKIYSSETTQQSIDTSGVRYFTNNGFIVNDSTRTNYNNHQFTSWTFRKQKGFFDVVEYTGTGSARTVDHNLGSIPGMILIKRLDSSDNWNVYHREMHSSSPAGYYMQLNTTDSIGGAANRWNNTSPTATEFTVGTAPVVNANGGTYIAYLFAGGDATNIDITNKTLTNLGDSFSSSYDMSYVNDGVAETSNAQSMGSVPSGGQFDIYVDLTSPHVVTKYKIAPQGGGNTQYNLPTKIEVYGTNDTSSWNLITTSQASYKGWYAGDYRDFPIPGLKSYRYWRIKVLQSRDSNGAATTATSISEWKLEGFSPSLDTEEYKFGGDGDKNIIDTGSYTGSGDSDGPEINLGWEPQWVIIKGVGSVNWAIFDSMRGVATKTHSSTGGDNYIHPDEYSNETANLERIEFTPTGFKITDGGWINTANTKHIYMAIRRSDGNVGKPVKDGTQVFSMPTGNGSSTIPNFTTNFVTDFATYRQPGSTHHWEQTARLMGTGYVYLNRNLAANHWDKLVFDSMIGFQNHSTHDAVYQAWAWKRHAGFDVQVYEGKGALSAPRLFDHNLGKPPEMIWVKNLSSAYDWRVWHKDLNTGGASAAPYNLILNSSGSQSANGDIFGGSGNVLPTATKWTTGGNASVNENGSNHLSVLFASVAGVSKVGTYTGTGSSGNSVNFGFQPRFLIVKKTSSGGWHVLDTVRGWGVGNDSDIELQNDAGAVTQIDWGAPTATGWDLGNNDIFNESGHKFIYYAHA